MIRLTHTDEHRRRSWPAGPILGLILLLAVPCSLLADARLNGKTRDADDNPLSGVVIKVTPADESKKAFETKSNKKGAFVFGLLRPGLYRLTAFQDGMRTSRIDANVALPEDESVWAFHEDVPPGGEPPRFNVTGLSTITYDLQFAPYSGDPGDFGTGLPVSPLTTIIGMIEGGQLDEAELEIRLILSAAPDSSTGNYLLAFILFSEQRLEEADQAIAKCLETEPTFEGGRLLRGRILDRLGDAEAALGEFNRELESAASTEVLRDTYLEAAILNGKLDRNADAVAVLERLIEIAPEEVQAYRELANLYLKLGREEQATEMMARVKELGALEPDVLYNLGAERFNANDFEAAAEYFGQLVELFPDYADGYFRLGLVRLSLGDRAGAAENMAKFLDISPEDHPSVPTARAILKQVSPD